MKLLNYIGRPTLGGLVLATVLFAVSSASRADNTNSVPADKPTPYPLATCVVSGDKLGEMGDPIVFVYQDAAKGINQEIKFCCPGCKPKFLKDPDKYMKTIHEAEAKAKDKEAKN